LNANNFLCIPAQKLNLVVTFLAVFMQFCFVPANGEKVRLNTLTLDYEPEMDYQMAHAKNYENRPNFATIELK